MGYKLAGYEVLGGVEIDPEMMAVYRENHKPKHSYLMGVQQFNKIPTNELPEEILNLDILDGSPPCSSFSMAGSREKKWGKSSKFREGQAVQVLDDLFFSFIETAAKLRPKVVIAENVKGLIQGNARGYVKQIFDGFNKIGYSCQLFLLNAAAMGVPQKRERTFFIANRLGKKIDLKFDEEQVSVKEAWSGIKSMGKDVSSSSMVKYWDKIKPGESMSSVHEKGSLFGQLKLHPNKPSPTLTSKEYQLWHWERPSLLSNEQSFRLQTFPDDYRCKDGKYICGMSVPPFMMQRVATEVQKQLLMV